MSRRKNKPKPQATAVPMVRAKFDVAKTTSQNRNHWVNADNLSARAALSPAVRRVVRARSRYEAENNSWYAGILNTAANHIIGNGPRLQVTSANVEGNARLERAWRQWTKRIDLADQLRIMFVSYWKDGEVFALRSFNARIDVPTDLKTLEADQITTPFYGAAISDQFVDDGVRFDADTNELQFYTLRNHPGGTTAVSGSDGEWIGADRMLHLFRAERPGQTRGIPRVTPSLQQLPIMRRQELATLYSAENVANFSMYLKTNSPVSVAESESAFAEREMARNMLTTLPEGWEIGQIEPKQPGPQYEMFQRQCLLSFGRCTNMPYALLSGTGKDSNFSSMKGDIRQLWEPEVVVEQNRMEVMVVDRLFRWFLEDCVIYAADVLAGMPPIREIDYVWTWPPVPDVDPIDTASTAITRIAGGLSSPSRELAKMNIDYEQHTTRAATDFGVDVATYKAAVFAKTFGIEPGAAPATMPVAAEAGPALPHGEYTSLGQRAFTNNQKRIKSTLDQLASGAIGQVMAEQTLASIGLSPDRIAALIADALDGGIEDAAVSEVAV